MSPTLVDGLVTCWLPHSYTQQEAWLWAYLLTYKSILTILLDSTGIQAKVVFSASRIERLLNHAKTPGFLAPGGEEFNPGPETRLDRSELLCNKVLYFGHPREELTHWKRL